MLSFFVMGYKKIFSAVFFVCFRTRAKYEISLLRYDIRRRRMMYLLRKCDVISVPAYAEGIYHSPKVGLCTVS